MIEVVCHSLASHLGMLVSDYRVAHVEFVVDFDTGID
jgi:hypothetical protein